MNIIDSCFLAISQFLLLFNFFDYNRMSYDGKMYPLWAEFCGWFMACIPIGIILFFAALKFVRTSEFARSSQDNTFRQVSVKLGDTLSLLFSN